jgi:hypothetical protein
MKHLSFFLIGIAALMLFSCSSTRNQLKQTAVLLASENQEMTVINKKTEAKAAQALETGSIDTQISLSFKTRFKELDQNIQQRDSLISLLQKERDIEKLKESIQSIERKIKYDSVSLGIMNESIDLKTYYEYPARAIFPSGKYKITDENSHDVRKLFKGAIDSIVYYANKYPTHKLTIHMITYGYADGQGFREGSDLYKELTEATGSDHPQREDMNQVLSQYRADGISAFLNDILFTQEGYRFINRIRIQVDTVGFGKGEEFPHSNIAYETEDERRRIVKFYWKIIPMNSDTDVSIR